MSASAFEALVVPVVLGTLGGCLVGAAILTVMNLAEALVGRLCRTIRSFQAASGPSRGGWRKPIGPSPTDVAQSNQNGHNPKASGDGRHLLSNMEWGLWSRHDKPGE